MTIFDAIAWAIGVILGIGGILAGVVKWVVMPNLREHLIKPVAETRDHVANDHKSNLRDDIDDVMRVVVAVQADISDLKESRDVESARLSRGDARMERIEKMIGHVSVSQLGYRERNETRTYEALERVRRLERIERERRELE